MFCEKFKYNSLHLIFITSLYFTHIPGSNNFYNQLRTLLLLLLLFYLVFNSNFIDYLSSRLTFKITMFYLILCLFLFISLLHSSNFLYGLKKLISFSLDYYPSTLIFAFFLTHNEKQFYKSSINIFTSLGVILTAIILIQGGISYISLENNLLHLGHIGAGKFLTFSFILTLFVSLNPNVILKKKYFINTALIFLFIGLYFSGLRSAMLITLFCIIILLISAKYLYKIDILKRLFYVLLFSAVLIYGISFFIASPEHRYKKAVIIEKCNISFDASITDRINAFNDSINIIKSDFLFGLGLGGYNNQEIRQLKYPHNILLEIFTELGFVGFISFILYLFILFKKVLKLNIVLGILVLISFSFSMFSGSMMDQKLLFICSCFIFLNISQTNNINNELDKVIYLR